jgi:hypothetical protein
MLCRLRKTMNGIDGSVISIKLGPWQADHRPPRQSRQLGGQDKS